MGLIGVSRQDLTPRGKRCLPFPSLTVKPLSRTAILTKTKAQPPSGASFA